MSPQRILIIEDEANIREVYAEVLKEGGFDVEEVSDGNEGLKKALEGNWDLIFLDIMLPQKDGLEILSDIKKDEKLKLKPVILLTNLGRESIIKQGREMGSEKYLVKSEITPDQVLAAAKDCLKGK